MNALSVCPGSAGLQEYLLGRVSDLKAAAVEAHLATCPACRNLLPDIQAEDDFVANFRAQAGYEPSKSALLDRLAADLRVLLQVVPTDLDATAVAGGEATASPDGAALEELRSLLALPQLPDEVGRLGEYRVLKVLGSGGMGIVFLAEDTRLRRQVALKAMKPERAASGRERQRFLREARLIATLTHDNVVAILQVGEEKGVPFLAMPLLQGESLEARLKREGRLPLADVLQIGREAAEGLAAAHARGLVHRDVKPSNLWLEALPGGRTRVKLLDFGLARDAEANADHLTDTGVVLGTPAYMAPEQAVGHLDHRADLFSLGCVLYRMTTGQAPFPGKTPLQVLAGVMRDDPRPPREINPKTPLALSDLILRLLDKDPARRPASAREVIQALQSLEQEEQQAAPHAARRRRWFLVVASLALAAGLIAVGTVLLTRTPTDRGDKGTPKAGRGEVDDEWVRRVAALPTEEQVKAIAAELKDRNPGFAGKVNPIRIENGAVKDLEIVTDNITDISPVRALAGLEGLVCKGSAPGQGRLTDLSAFKNMKLRAVTWLDTPCVDLSSLKGLPLNQLNCNDPNVADLTPLKGMPLKNLSIQNTSVASLAPLESMRLTSLDCSGTQVRDLKPLRGMPLGYLSCRNTPVDDLSPVARLPLLFSLDCRGTKAPSLAPLKGVTLKVLSCDFNPQLDTEVLRSIKTLEQINGKPAKEFWKEVGESKRDKEP
jgi:tRNA A-37 threonylcarbamoyl transferase component Bud32